MPARRNAPLALILHPHPLHGGTMNNKVVFDLFHMFARRGFSVLRFNFRGVGRSQESFDHGQGELRDAAAALDWMQQHNANSSGLLGRRLLVRRLDRHAAADAPARRSTASSASRCRPTCTTSASSHPARPPGLIVHGGADALVPTEFGRRAGAEAVAAARHQDRPRGDPGRRPFLQRPSGASSAARSRATSTCSAAARAGTRRSSRTAGR